jgi:hypothetical protein
LLGSPGIGDPPSHDANVLLPVLARAETQRTIAARAPERHARPRAFQFTREIRSMSFANRLRRHSTALGLGAVLCSSMTAAQAFDLSTLSLSFTQPTGTAATTDDIPVYLTLSLAASATDSLNYDATVSPTGGLPSDLVPTHGMFNNRAAFATYTLASLSSSYGCSGTFTNGVCPSSTTTYNFHWATMPNQLVLAPGDSYTYLMGTFTPNGGEALAGTYTFYYAALMVFFDGYDANGQFLFAFTDLADTGWNGAGFTRTVGVVPEPTSCLMLLTGLGLMGSVVRRRSNAG